MFFLDVMSRTPVYEQIISQFEEYVLTGILQEGSQLPSVRSLSTELSINPNTIQKAYTELDRRGLTYSVPGKGVFTAQGAAESIRMAKKQKLTAFIELTEELRLAGVSEEKLCTCIRNLYVKKGGRMQ